MPKPRILVVEDERVVAADIEESLRKLGYAVVGGAASGVHAIRRAVETDPDLVLMDIKLKGGMDGIDAASELHGRLGIPVVFLTAYADGEILDRAKKSSPSGYVLKPFDERALRSAVEIALDRHPRERRLAESEHRLVTALRGMDDAVLLTGTDGRVTFLNQAAERITGWRHSEASGKRVTDVLLLLNTRTGSLLPDLAARATREGAALGLGDDALVVNRYGGETRVEGSVTPLTDEDHETVGAVIVCRASGETASQPAETFRAGDRNRAAVIARLAAALSESLQRALCDLDTALESRANGDGAGQAIDRSKLHDAIELLKHFHSLARPRIPRPREIVLNELVEGLDPLLSAVVPQSISVDTLTRADAGEISADPPQVELAVLELVHLCGQRMPFGGQISLDTDSVELLPEYARNHTNLKPGPYSVLSVRHAGSVLIPPSEDVREDCPNVQEEIARMGGDIQLRYEPGRVTTYEIHLPRITS